MNQEKILTLIDSPYITEKASKLASEKNQVVFKVNINANKLEITIGSRNEGYVEEGLLFLLSQIFIKVSLISHCLIKNQKMVAEIIMAGLPFVIRAVDINNIIEL